MKTLPEYERHVRGDGLRFHVRVVDRGDGQRWEVYGYGLDHLCDCTNSETANLIASSLETLANLQEGGFENVVAWKASEKPS